MDKELIKNIDALTVNYISLKSLKMENLSKNNPIFKYFNEYIYNEHSNKMMDFMNDIKNMKDIDNNYKNVYSKLFSSNFNESMNINENLLLGIIQQSYKLYLELDNYNSFDKNKIFDILGSYFKEQIDSEYAINTIKNDFTDSFKYVLRNMDINDEELIHIKINVLDNFDIGDIDDDKIINAKIKSLEKKIEKYVQIEDYLKAAECKKQIDELKEKRDN